MIRTKIVEIRETDLETANDLLKDPHWTFVTAVTNNNTQTVKYVLKRKDTYDEQVPDYELTIPFKASDIAGRDHMCKNAEYTFRELRADIKGMAKDFSADGKNVSRPPEMIEFAERNKIEIPDYVAKQEYVDGKLLAKAIKEAPIIEVSQAMRNMTLSELLYLLTYKKSRKD